MFLNYIVSLRHFIIESFNMLIHPYKANQLEAGCDEAGRGCLSGPVFAAAVILPEGYENELLNDSKQMTEKKRNEARIQIENEAQAWAVASVSPEEIDQINILNASFLAMHRAIEKLSPAPDFLLIDGNRFNPYKDLPFECMIKGDGRFLSIAAASILAKTYRDDYMKKIAKDHPQYDWQKNKGYPTKAHRQAILEHGATPHHRKSFRLLPDAVQGKLF